MRASRVRVVRSIRAREEGALGFVGLDRNGREAESAIERIARAAVIDLVGEDREGNPTGIGPAGAFLEVTAVVALRHFILGPLAKHIPLLQASPSGWG